MSEWWTYRLTSFLLFSPRTYYRLLELYNLAIWPTQLAGIAIGLAIIALLMGKRASAIASSPACWPPAGCGSHWHFITSATLRSTGRRRGSRSRSHWRGCSSSLSALSPANSVSNVPRWRTLDRSLDSCNFDPRVSDIGATHGASVDDRRDIRRGARPDGDCDRGGSGTGPWAHPMASVGCSIALVHVAAATLFAMGAPEAWSWSWLPCSRCRLRSREPVTREGTPNTRSARRVADSDAAVEERRALDRREPVSRARARRVQSRLLKCRSPDAVDAIFREPQRAVGGCRDVIGAVTVGRDEALVEFLDRPRGRDSRDLVVC